MYSVGEIQLPCGTPLSKGKEGPSKVLREIDAVLLSIKLQSSLVIMVGSCKLEILYFRPLCQTLSNAFDTSRAMRQHCVLFLAALEMASVVIARAVSVDLFLRNPCCELGRQLFCSRKFLSLRLMIFFIYFTRYFQ